jgi:hypothetical protein
VANDLLEAYILELANTQEERSKVARQPCHPVRLEANDSVKACILELVDTREESPRSLDDLIALHSERPMTGSKPASSSS